MYTRRITVAAIMVLSLAAGLPAEEWAIIGARALGMGGTGVACARGASAYYWNPAHYANTIEADLSIPVGFGLGLEGDLIEKGDFITGRLDTLDFEALQNKFNTDQANLTTTDFHNAFEIMLVDIPMLADYGTGITATVSAGAVARFGRYGVALMGIGYGGAHPVVDMAASSGVAMSDIGFAAFASIAGIGYGDHSSDLSTPGSSIAADLMSTYSLSSDTATTFVWLAETTPANPQGATVDLANPTTAAIFNAMAEATFGNEATPGTYEVMFDNLSGMDLGLISTQEVAFTGARSFMDGRMSLGVNVKGIIADTIHTRIIISQIEDGSSIATEVMTVQEDGLTSRRLGVDLGWLMNVTDTFTVGGVIRNANQPTFSVAGDPDGFTLLTQYRGGVAWKPTRSLTLASDLDLFTNFRFPDPCGVD